MKLSDFYYQLPKELIAQQPASPRDHSRLLVLDRVSGHLEHRHFFDLPLYLRRGDVLVLNETKVFPARLIGKKEKTGGRVEVFLLRKADLTSLWHKSTPASPPRLADAHRREAGGHPSSEGNGEVWRCLIGGKNKSAEQAIIFSKKLHGRVMERAQDGTWLVRFNLIGKKFTEEIEKIGEVPLPPYIKRDKPSKTDEARYQTVYASKKQASSVAAPTAGLHFTPALLKKIKAQGVELAHLTLHVGLGTFLPVKTENIKDHQMHAEWYEVNKKTLEVIEKAKINKRRIIAVGTTSARVLETVGSNGIKKLSAKSYQLQAISGETGIYIYPGYRFKVVDALITNFHLPESTLLMLVSAFAGQADKNKSTGLVKIKKAYARAIKNKYHFFSYGDAMLIK